MNAEEAENIYVLAHILDIGWAPMSEAGKAHWREALADEEWLPIYAALRGSSWPRERPLTLEEVIEAGL